MSTHRASRRNAAFRKGFTLIEILVVLAIAAIITSITVGGFKEMSAGNKRVSCQSNLAQIYQSCRMYAADEGGKFPFFATVAGTTVNQTACPIGMNSGIGLWALYTFPNSGFSAPDPTRPIERYIRSAKVLHCPSDVDTAHGNLMVSPSVYNLDYLSYQSCDDTTPTYASVRTTSTSDPALWKKQLMHFNTTTNTTSPVPRPPDDKTIVTWCRFHRGSRNMDNVLFYDGSVQLLPTKSDVTTNWYRDPKTPQ